MTSIPFDVLMEILPLVETSDLLAMARTNRDLSDYALDRIYGHILSKNMKAACQSVSSNPSLAQRVRSLEINYSHGDHGYHLESILPSFRDALRVTLNLRTLKLDINGNHSWVLKPALGAFKLRSFSCYAYTDQDLLDFLRDQTELEEIMLSHSYTFIEHGAPIKFPGLKKFHGPMTWADLIIPHEPVSHVEISYIGHGSPIASLGLSTAPIRHLRIPIHAVDKRQPRELKVLFPALKNLVLTVSQTLVLRLVSAIKIWEKRGAQNEILGV
jgi:hypothetical protein